MSDQKQPAVVTLHDKRDTYNEPSERQVIISIYSHEMLKLDFTASGYEDNSSVDIWRMMHTENRIITLSEPELRAFVGAALSWLKDREEWSETQRNRPEPEDLPF